MKLVTTPFLAWLLASLLRVAAELRVSKQLSDRPVPGAADLMHARHLQDCEAISWADLCGRELTAGSCFQLQPSETPSCQLQGPQGAAVQLRAAQDIVTLQTLGELRITGHFQMTSLRLEAQTLNFEDAEVEAWHEVSSAPNLTTKGGAFYSSGSFTVTRSNLTVRGTGAAYGGGFFAGGDLSICQNAKVVVENVSAKLDGGGFFVLGDADISDDSLVFIRHARSGELGGGFKTKRRLQVTNRSTVNIVNATSGKQGGGFQVNGRLQVTDSSSVSLQNVTAGQHGGGFFALGEVEIAGSSTVNIRNSHAESGDGGGFDIESSMKVSTGSTLRMHNATAGRWGGGFYARKVVISGSAVSIQHASAEEQGGGFYAKEIVVEMMSTVNIVNATSGEQGGGFQVEGRLHVIGSSCVSLQNVTAGTYGGGFLAIGEVEIAGSSTINITNSTAGFSGGGFAVKGPIVSNRSTLRILNAKAGSYGGGFDATKVLISGSSVSLQNVTAGTHGGGFRALGEVEIAGSSTVNIRNSHAESGSGGGFDIEGLKVLTGSTLRIWNARAEWYGGGFSARTVVIRGSTVSIQHAAAEALGGGFVSEKVVVAAMSTVNIFRASAGQGGGCQVEGRFQVTNSSAVSVQHAAAREQGGGFYAKEIVVEMMSTVNIVNATSGERGGGFQVDGRLQVTNSSSVSLQNVTAGTLGGGFSVYGNVEIAGSSTINIANSHAKSDGGGFKGSAALIISRGSTLRIWNATAGGSGGGFVAKQVAMSSSKLGVQHVTAGQYGGGFVADVVLAGHSILNIVHAASGEQGGGFQVDGRLHVANSSTISVQHASAEEAGGGFVADEVAIDGMSTVNIVNATSGEQGGGFAVDGRLQVTDRSSVSLQNVTAGTSGGGFVAHGEVEIAGSSTVNIRNSHAESGDGGGFLARNGLTISNSSVLRIRNAAAGKYGGGFQANKVLISSSRVSIQETRAGETGGGFHVLGNVALANASTLNLSNTYAGLDGGGFFAAGLIAQTSLISISNATASQSGTGCSAGGQVLLSSQSNLEIRGAHGIENSSVLTANCLHIRDKSSIRFEGVTGGHVVDLQNSGCSSQCSNKTFEVASNAAFNATGHLSGGLLSVAACENETVRLSGIDLKSWSTSLLSTRPSQVVVDGVSVEYVPPVNNLQVLAAKDGFTIDSLTAFCPACGHGVTFNASHDGRLQALSPETLQCSRRATVSKGLTPLCNCTSYQITSERFSDQDTVSFEDVFQTCKFCSPHFQSQNGACQKCGIFKAWSDGKYDGCHFLPRKEAERMIVFTGAAVFVIMTFIVFEILQAPLVIVDAKSSLADPADVAGKKTFTMSVQGPIVDLHKNLSRLVHQRVCYRANGTGLEWLDYYQNKAGNAIKVRSIARRKLLLQDAQVPFDCASCRGSLRPSGICYVFTFCIALIWLVVMLPVTIKLAVMSKNDSEHVVATTVYVTLPMIVVAALLHVPVALLIQRMYRRTIFSEALDEYRKQIRCEPHPGPDATHPGNQGLQVQILRGLWKHFESHILARNMHFVVANIVRPLTESKGVSFVTLWGGPPQSACRKVDYFVSHSWGTRFLHFVHSMHSHALCKEGPTCWSNTTYWICSFANNQWNITAELGSDPMDSAFARALTSGIKGVAMVLDKEVQPLTRVWCLFEFFLSSREHLDLVFVTDVGVLGDDCCTLCDTVIHLGKKIESLQVAKCEASSEKDKKDIFDYIISELGSLKQMDRQIRSLMSAMLLKNLTNVGNATENLVQRLGQI